MTNGEIEVLSAYRNIEPIPKDDKTGRSEHAFAGWEDVEDVASCGSIRTFHQ